MVDGPERRLQVCVHVYVHPLFAEWRGVGRLTDHWCWGGRALVDVCFSIVEGSSARTENKAAGECSEKWASLSSGPEHKGLVSWPSYWHQTRRQKLLQVQAQAVIHSQKNGKGSAMGPGSPEAKLEKTLPGQVRLWGETSEGVRKAWLGRGKGKELLWVELSSVNYSEVILHRGKESVSLPISRSQAKGCPWDRTVISQAPLAEPDVMLTGSSLEGVQLWRPGSQTSQQLEDRCTFPAKALVAGASQGASHPSRSSIPVN